MKTDLEKLRAREARLEEAIREEVSELGRIADNLTHLAEHLSECKKAIGTLTIGKMRTA